MDSQRQQKFGRQIQKDLSEIFQRDMPITPVGGLVTISHVRVSPDLAIASVYLSFLGVPVPATVLAELEEKNKAVRNLLGRMIGKQARVVPELRFFEDNTAQEAERIEKLIATLNIPKQTPEEGNPQDYR